MVRLSRLYPLPRINGIVALTRYPKLRRMSLAQNWRRRGMFDEVAFIFPNAPMIPITVVCLWTCFAG